MIESSTTRNNGCILKHAGDLQPVEEKEETLYRDLSNFVENLPDIHFLHNAELLLGRYTKYSSSHSNSTKQKMYEVMKSWLFGLVLKVEVKPSMSELASRLKTKMRRYALV